MTNHSYPLNKLTIQNRGRKNPQARYSGDTYQKTRRTRHRRDHAPVVKPFSVPVARPQFVVARDVPRMIPRAVPCYNHDGGVTTYMYEFVYR